MQKRLFTLVVMLMTLVGTALAQVTTSGISGKVTSGQDDVIGATVTATHQPSGTVYRAVTNIDGRFSIQGMRVGGPYKVEVSYIGMKPRKFENINLTLGETEDLSCSLATDSKELEEVVVTGQAGLDATKTGAAQSITARQINDMPTVSHSIADIARLNPQITTNVESGAMSFAGTNNRYNSFQIDGAMNNDMFGLTSGGINGGQASTQPVSMETVDQIQINVAPYDVRQSGFTGGAINAITKSGTNDFHGSAYIYGNNENLVGRHYKLPNGKYADPYSDESETMFGFTLGGPIVKNKLFFFANYERSKKSYPNEYGLGTENSQVDAEQATKILDAVKDLANRQGVNYNSHYDNSDADTWSNKAGVKIDWNINDYNKFMVRWSYVNAANLSGRGGISTLNTLDHLYRYKSTTNTVTAELQSRLSPVLSNEARLSYVGVRDKRTSGAAFPSITIYNVGKGTVNLGNDYSSMANGLNQDVWTLEDNLTWYKGNHTFTFGTHNELYKFDNLFIQNLYGRYYFQNTDDFFSYYNGVVNGSDQPLGSYINRYYFSQANTAVTGDPLWSAAFSAGQLGFYAQDKWDVNRKFQLTYGLRFDIPLFFDTPAENAPFNEWAAEQAAKADQDPSYKDFAGLKTNHKLASKLMVSPRVGFRYDIAGDKRFILRGGIGIFTGRIPFVWLSNNFTNTGVQLESYQATGNGTKDITLILDPNRQAENAANLKASGSQTINVFDKDFKFAQNLRLNLGFDFQALGINWTAEAIYSKVLNDVYYQNLAYKETGKTLADVTGLAWDDRPMYERISTGTAFNNIYVLRNTSKGYTWNLSLKAEKHFNFGLDLMASYSFTNSKSVGSPTSSVAQSNWRNTHTYRYSNKPELANSAFNIPHVIKASAFYHIDYGRNKMFTTTIGLIYQGSSGSPYSVIYNGDINGDNGTSNDLFFIPTDEQIDQMPFKATKAYSVDAQRANLKEWLANTPYLRDHRGEYYKRYADNLPFESHFDLHVAQKFNLKVGSYVHSLELSLDIMNVANLLNKDWGRTYSSGYVSEFMSPVTYSKGEYQFLQPADYVLKYPNTYYSRWRGQIGLKYTF